jgi:hypothetical protein
MTNNFIILTYFIDYCTFTAKKVYLQSLKSIYII